MILEKTPGSKHSGTNHSRISKNNKYFKQNNIFKFPLICLAEIYYTQSYVKCGGSGIAGAFDWIYGYEFCSWDNIFE